MALLTLFLLRVTFGLALGMAITSPKLVSSGYYRNHLYVTLGVASLAALLSRVAAPEALLYAVAAAIFSYIGAIAWLYEKAVLGKAMLLVVIATSLIGSTQINAALIDGKSESTLESYSPAIDRNTTLKVADANRLQDRAIRMGMTSGFMSEVVNVTSGCLVGVTMAAMLLGHWYLNSPGMKLEPLRKLLVAMGIAVALQAALCGAGLALELAAREPAASWGLFIALRWMFGLIGVAVLIVMAWKTLAIPNTQAATGILYVAVIGVFVGETMSLLLSAETLYPV